MNNTIEQFININSQIKDLEQLRDSLKSDIMNDMKRNKLSTQSLDQGIFTIASKTSWEYTKAIKKLSEELKVKQVKEQQSGKAKAKVTEYLRFTPLANQ